MRYLFVSIFCFLACSGVYAQETSIEDELFPRDISRNELSGNVFNILIFGALDFGYERIISDHSSLSVDVFTKFINKNEDEDIDPSQVYAKDFSVATKFKFFFREENSAWGFYAEAFGMLSDGNNEKEVEKIDSEGYTFYESEEFDYTDLALGVGIGHKYVAKQGFVIDLSFGLGRNLFHKNSPDLVLLPSINVGYRF